MFGLRRRSILISLVITKMSTYFHFISCFLDRLIWERKHWKLQNIVFTISNTRKIFSHSIQKVGLIFESMARQNRGSRRKAHPSSLTENCGSLKTILQSNDSKDTYDPGILSIHPSLIFDYDFRHNYLNYQNFSQPENQ